MRARAREFLALLGTLAFCAFVSAADIRPRMLLLDAALSGKDIIAVGERGTILRSSDNARTWQRPLSGTRATLTGIAFAPGFEKHGWAVGHDALILATTDGGLTWTKQFQGDDLQDSFLDIIALDDKRAIAVGAYALYAHTAASGKTWVRRKIIDDDAHLNRISSGADGMLYVAGEHGTLLHSRDQGATWQRLPAPYDGSFYGLAPIAAGSLIAYGLEGRVFRSTDAGLTWNPLANHEPVLLATGLPLARTRFLLAGQSRTLFEVTPESLTASANRLHASVAELLELPDGNFLAVGEAGAEVLSSSTLQPLR